jgi:hypothetical protein
MPSVRFVKIEGDRFSFADHRGATKVFLYSSLPGSANTIAKAETFANNWLASNVDGYQMRVHVFSLNPLRITIGTWDLGLDIPANWWE